MLDTSIHRQQTIPVNEPMIGQREFEYIQECLSTGWISSSGRFIHEFEERWASYCGMTHGVAVSNGTVALQLAVACLDLKPGDEVIIPTFTIISCAQAVTYNGGVPVLVDAEPNTWCMNVHQIERRITPRTRAIMAVHIYGHPVDMDPLLELAKVHNLIVIEDAAEAHGAEYKGQRCGGLGDISCFSFYANKIVTTGEGGMVLTAREDWADRLRSLRNLFFQTERRFYHEQLGHNFRMTNIQAALGLAQVERIDRLVERKRRIAAAYTEQLSQVPDLGLPIEEPWAKNVFWMYGVVLDHGTGLDADEFARRLAKRGVATRPFFLGMHEQPALQRMGLFRGEGYPVAERISRQGLYLPSGMALTDDQVSYVCSAVHEVLARIDQ
jgi:perosamine synthetase